MTLKYYDGQRILVNGYHYNISFHLDEGYGAPWKEHDGCGVVEECNWRDKRPWERLLNPSERGNGRHWGFYYDMRATREKAIKESWGVSDEEGKGLTRKQKLALAIEKDFKYCAGWLNDDWQWTYVKVFCEETGEDDSVGGFCSDDWTGIDDCVDNLIDQLDPTDPFIKLMFKRRDELRMCNS